MKFDDVATPALFMVAVFFFVLWIGTLAIHAATDPFVAQLSASL